MCVFQVSRPYLGFCHDPKPFIVNVEENIVKYAEKWGKSSEKCNIYIKYFTTIPSFFSEVKWLNILMVITK